MRHWRQWQEIQLVPLMSDIIGKSVEVSIEHRLPNKKAIHICHSAMEAMLVTLKMNHTRPPTDMCVEAMQPMGT